MPRPRKERVVDAEVVEEDSSGDGEPLTPDDFFAEIQMINGSLSRIAESLEILIGIDSGDDDDEDDDDDRSRRRVRSSGVAEAGFGILGSLLDAVRARNAK